MTSMTITFKPYRRRDGSLMLYINNDRGVSIGLSPEKGFSAYGKGSTEGQRKLSDAALAAFRAASKSFTGSVAAHDEPKAECGNYILLITDNATIGGMKVGSDGAYVVRDGHYLRCGEPLTVDA